MQGASRTLANEPQADEDDSDKEQFDLKHSSKEYIAKQRKKRFNRKVNELLFPDNPTLFGKPEPPQPGVGSPPRTAKASLMANRG